MLPGNCDTTLGYQGGPKCPHCGQWHLRAGYCQALDADGKLKGVTVKPSPVTDMALSVTDKLEAVTVKRCTVCAKPMPDSARADARFCSSKCRVKANRAKPKA